MKKFYTVERGSGNIEFYEDLRPLFAEFNEIFEDSMGRESSMSLQEFENELVNSKMAREMIDVKIFGVPDNNDLEKFTSEYDKHTKKAKDLRKYIDQIVLNTLEGDELGSDDLKNLIKFSSSPVRKIYDYAKGDGFNVVSHNQRQALVRLKHEAMQRTIELKVAKIQNMHDRSAIDKLSKEIEKLNTEMDKDNKYEEQRIKEYNARILNK